MRRFLILLLLPASCATSDFDKWSKLEREIRLAHVRHSPESELSLWLARADGTEIVAIDPDRRVPGASTVKVLILVEAFAQAAEGTFDLGGSMTFLEEDRVDGSGSLQYEKAGSTFTNRQLLRKMIAESDNVASNMLLKRLGMRKINARALRLGMVTTQFERAFRDEEARLRQGKENWTTAKEMGRLLLAIFRREILTREACDEMIAILEKTSRGPIARGVPKFVPVGHKGGVLPGIRHEVGWVRLPGHPYILSVFQTNTLEPHHEGEEDHGLAAIGAVAGVVYGALGPSDE